MALDRATLAALFDTYSSIVSLALGKQGDNSITTWAHNLTDRDLRKRTGDASQLFKAFSKEPKLFVDAVELDPTELRCTLALAATASSDDHLDHIDLGGAAGGHVRRVV